MPEYLVIINFNNNYGLGERFDYKAFQDSDTAHRYFHDMIDAFEGALDYMSLFKYENDDYHCLIKAV